jgi:AraC-like DNA-binding protein
MYTYSGQLVVNGKIYEIRPGSVSLTPPWSDIVFNFVETSYHVSSFFDFPQDIQATRNMPTMLYFDQEQEVFSQLFRAMEEAKQFYPLFMRRTEVRIWDILLSLSDHAENISTKDEQIPKHVRNCVSYIENNLHRRITVEEIALWSQYTPTHLTRLFQKWFNLSVIEYIRWRRAQKARDMLLHTMRPIKTIAADVGLPDLQHFYKTIKKEFNQTPLEIRKGVINADGHIYSTTSDDG